MGFINKLFGKDKVYPRVPLPWENPEHKRPIENVEMYEMFSKRFDPRVVDNMRRLGVFSNEEDCCNINE